MGALESQEEMTAVLPLASIIEDITQILRVGLYII